MTADSIDLDHTSFAVEDAIAWAGRLRRELGAVPVAGEALAEFRYLLLYVGTAQAGARIELLDPVGDGFLSRFLERRGAGPHHLTFTVPDLRAAVAQARDLGATVVGEEYSHSSWHEAFLMPDAAHGVVIQLAQTDLAYPTPAELQAPSVRDTWAFPSSYGASDPLWWEAVWDVDRGPAAVLGPTRLGSTDLSYTRMLFGGLLGATVTDRPDALELSWPSGTILVHQSECPGVVGMALDGGPAGGVRIGQALLGELAHAYTARVTDAGADAVALTAELVGIDSVNPGLVPGAAGERRIAEHLRSRLDRAGFATTVVAAPGDADRPSLVAVPVVPGSGPTVVLNGHLDTVGVTGMAEPFTPRIEGERLSGRGAADMKGGLAALVVAAERLVASGAPVRPVLALTADEEDVCLGCEAVIEALPGLGIRPDVCLVAEPTDLALARSQRGFAVVKVGFAGRAAHSSQPELGINAVTHLGRFLAAVDQRAPAVREAGGDLLATVARGGESAFVIPSEAECLVERRTVPGERAGDALEEIRALLDPAWHATAELVAHREAWRLDGEGSAAELAQRLGEELATGVTFDAPYWMEASMWQDVCPTLICGPSGGGMHAVDEWVDLRQVRAFVSALVAVLAAPATWGARAD